MNVAMLIDFIELVSEWLATLGGRVAVAGYSVIGIWDGSLELVD